VSNIYSLFVGDNRIVLYSIDNSTNNIENCPCGLIYKVEKKEDELTVYILYIATHYKCRKTGYASIFINEFIDFIKKRYSRKNKNISIVLDALETAVTFYEHFGFKWTTTEKKYDEIFHVEETKHEIEHFIMVYKL
jgi:predicted GNAT family N-acyltransferase